MRVIVIGAGVIGLTCATRLLDEGFDVDVVARDLPEETTSAVAAAIWYPYLAEPVDKVTAWSATSYQRFIELGKTDPDTGIRMRWGTELHRLPQSAPEWAASVRGFQRVSPPPTGFRDAWRFETPVIDMAIYLDWLSRRITEAGGRITRMALPGMPNRAPLVVNCSGLAARSLVGDLDLTPVRGQVVRLSQVGLTEWLLDASAGGETSTYVVPRINDIVVGGTAQHGDWNRRPDADTAAEMLQHARALVPELAEAEVLTHRVGLRPSRSTIRLETEHTPDGTGIVHCYGHGGAGVTLSWGCADEVAAKVRNLVTT
ncbi:MAG: FAD-dependent oxidoreductase [Streptosporangiales bacterium]|nr:FAD-dependent oxidoreductase [Streptosporangiales bacterium]